MPRYSVSILRPDDSSEFLTFEKPLVLIGREGGDIVTADPLMSNRHAEFVFEGGALSLRDLGSTNGTFRVSGERVEGTISLQPGTTLKLGACTFTIQDIELEAGAEGGLERGGTAVLPQMPVSGSDPTAPSEAAAQATTNPSASPEEKSPDAMAKVGEALNDLATAGPASDGLLDQFKFFFAQGMTLYKEHYMDGVMTMGLVMVPATLISAALGWIPILGILVSILIALAQLALAPISAGAMGRWALSAASGKPLSWKHAWGAALKEPKKEWIQMAVASFVTTIGTFCLLIPGIMLGMFALPAYLLEDKKMLAINKRSMDLVNKDMGRHIGLGLLVLLLIVPTMIVAVVLSMVLVYVPMIGIPLGTVVSMVLLMFVLPFVYLLWALIYFDSTKRLENISMSEAFPDSKYEEWTANELKL